jgi:hypothetical protein
LRELTKEEYYEQYYLEQKRLALEAEASKTIDSSSRDLEVQEINPIEGKELTEFDFYFNKKVHELSNGNERKKEALLNDSNFYNELLDAFNNESSEESSQWPAKDFTNEWPEKDLSEETPVFERDVYNCDNTDSCYPNDNFCDDGYSWCNYEVGADCTDCGNCYDPACDGVEDCASEVYDCLGVCDGAAVVDSCGDCDGGDANAGRISCGSGSTDATGSLTDDGGADGNYANSTDYTFTIDIGSGAVQLTFTELYFETNYDHLYVTCDGATTDYTGNIGATIHSCTGSSVTLNQTADSSVNKPGFALTWAEAPADAVLGCTDDTACNYNVDATQDDGSCELPGSSCSCPKSFGAGNTWSVDYQGIFVFELRFHCIFQ